MAWRLPHGFPDRDGARRRRDRDALRGTLARFFLLVGLWSGLAALAITIMAAAGGALSMVAFLPLGFLPLLLAIHISSAPSALARRIDEPDRAWTRSLLDLFRPRSAWAAPLRGMNPRSRAVALVHADRAGIDLAQAADAVRRWMALPDVPRAFTADRRAQILAGAAALVPGLAVGFAGPFLVAPAVGGGVAGYFLAFLLPVLVGLFAVGGVLETYRAVRIAWVLDVLVARQVEDDRRRAQEAAQAVTTRAFAGTGPGA